MSINLNSIVDYLHPTPSGIAVLTADQIWVVFDREIDETTVTAGNLFVTGADFDTWSGPDLQLFFDRASIGDEAEILQSAGYHGFVHGTISFERIDLSTLTTVSTLDTVGSGQLFRTKAIFTPTNQLQVDSDFAVHLSGDEDETDILQTGISERTVFDAVASGVNTGTGEVTFTGGYSDTVDGDIYRVIITTAGEVGTARFKFSRASDALTLYGPFKTKQSGVLLSDGVTAFFAAGTYEVGDQWSVLVRARSTFTGNLVWPFKTGSGSIQSIPTTVSTSVIGDPITTASVSAAATSSFLVSSTNPEDETSHLTIADGDLPITITFNKAIDPTTVFSGISVVVNATSVTGETDTVALGDLVASPSVNGTALTITVASGQIYNNNLITVTVDKTVGALDGTFLDEDYEFWFTSTYYPMYCTFRLVNLRVGAFISDLKDDTINMALHVASKEADMLTWNKVNADSEYYQFVRGQWACCRAAFYLLTNTIGGNGAVKSKRLGDLSVEYNTSVDTAKPLKAVEDCMAKWEGALMVGGSQVQTPVGVVKGELDPDRPNIGRGWYNNPNNQIPAANNRVRLPGSRRFRSLYSRGWWK